MKEMTEGVEVGTTEETMNLQGTRMLIYWWYIHFDCDYVPSTLWLYCLSVFVQKVCHTQGIGLTSWVWFCCAHICVNCELNQQLSSRVISQASDVTIGASLVSLPHTSDSLPTLLTNVSEGRDDKCRWRGWWCVNAVYLDAIATAVNNWCHDEIYGQRVTRTRVSYPYPSIHPSVTPDRQMSIRKSAQHSYVPRKGMTRLESNANEDFLFWRKPCLAPNVCWFLYSLAVQTSTNIPCCF